VAGIVLNEAVFVKAMHTSYIMF